MANNLAVVVFIGSILLNERIVDIRCLEERVQFIQKIVPILDVGTRRGISRTQHEILRINTRWTGPQL